MSKSNLIDIPHILSISDSYSDGSSGIQIDLKTFRGLSTSGLSVITGLATRTNNDIKVIHTVPEEFVRSQFDSVTNNIEINALKIGMNFSLSLIDLMVSLLTKTQIPNIVLDPIMLKDQLSSDNLIILRNKFLAVATLITPTVDETSILLDRNILSIEDMKHAARDLHCLGPKYVLIRNDKLSLDASHKIQDQYNDNVTLTDVLFDGLHFTLFKSSYVSTRNTHQIRCILTAAITAYLGRGMNMIDAVQNAIAYTHSIIQNSLLLDFNNDLLINKSVDNCLYENSQYKPSVINEQQEEQKSSLNSTDKVIIVNNQSWIHQKQVLLHKRSFVQLLKNACSKEWFDYTHHPFIEGLANGTLPYSSFKHYLIQDYIFLTHFARCYALAAYKSKNMSDILFAGENLCNIGRESKLHISYCAEWGIDITNLSSTTEARANLAYTRFTLDCGMTGDLLDLYVSLSPCLLGYGEIGLRLFNDQSTNRQSPYWKWILSYADNDYQQGCHQSEQLLERLADEYSVWNSDARINKLIDTFKTATKLEIGFWNMGLHLEW